MGKFGIPQHVVLIKLNGGQFLDVLLKNHAKPICQQFKAILIIDLEEGPNVLHVCCPQWPGRQAMIFAFLINVLFTDCRAIT